MVAAATAAAGWVDGMDDDDSVGFGALVVDNGVGWGGGCTTGSAERDTIVNSMGEALTLASVAGLTDGTDSAEVVG